MTIIWKKNKKKNDKENDPNKVFAMYFLPEDIWNARILSVGNGFTVAQFRFSVVISGNKH